MTTYSADAQPVKRRRRRRKTTQLLSAGQIGAWFGVSADAVLKWRIRPGRRFPVPDHVTGEPGKSNGAVYGWHPNREWEIREWYEQRAAEGRRGLRRTVSEPEP